VISVITENYMGRKQKEVLITEIKYETGFYSLIINIKVTTLNLAKTK